MKVESELISVEVLETKKKLVSLVLRKMLKSGELIEIGTYAENTPTADRRIRIHPSMRDD